MVGRGACSGIFKAHFLSVQDQLQLDMPANFTSDNSHKSARRDFPVFLFCLLSILAILFHKSFDPEQVLFSNDGPLGPNRSQAEYVLSHFQGYWQDLNWLGMSYPGLFLNVSGLLMAACSLISPGFGPVLFAKIYAPAGLFLLGLGGWLLFRQLRFRPWVCLTGGLAMALNTTAFSPACWGLPTWPLSWAMNLFALAALATPAIQVPALKTMLAGFAVGIGVMEGFDVGAIFSIFTAAFALLQGVSSREILGKQIAKSLASVATMALCAVLIAAQAVTSLIATQVKGVVGMAQDETTKQQRWDQATAGSLPKTETLRVIIPGLFGYRMPELYGEPVESGAGSNYWGAVGQSPPGAIQSRHSGMGISAGVLVALVALFGTAQSFRKKGNAFSASERSQIWCWLGLLSVSLLLAWGRYAPFYRLFYALPYASTIRNPFKFIFPFSMALVILFGYGLEAIFRLHLNKSVHRAIDWREQLKAWWKIAPVFDRKWTIASLAAVASALLAWLVFASSKNELIRFLEQAGFSHLQYPQLAASIARFSLNQVGLFVLVLVVSVALQTLIMSGILSGVRSNWAMLAIGLVTVLDLARADSPWIVYWNYKQKYASNPIIDALREKPYEHRVTAKLAPLSGQFLVDYRDQEAPVFIQVYFGEWLQHHFQFYRIQSLDIIQMPREPEFDKAYMTALRPAPPALYTILNKLGLLDPKSAAAMASQLVDDGTAKLAPV